MDDYDEYPDPAAETSNVGNVSRDLDQSLLDMVRSLAQYGFRLIFRRSILALLVNDDASKF